MMSEQTSRTRAGRRADGGAIDRHLTSIPTAETLVRGLVEVPYNETAWKRFFLCYGETIMSWAILRGLNPSEAEDLLQETALSLMRTCAAGRFEYRARKGSLRKWLTITTSNKVTDQHRKRSRTPESSEDDTEASEDSCSPIERVGDDGQSCDRMRLRLDLAELLNRSLERLGPADRKLAELYIEGASREKSAMTLGIAVNAYDVRLHRLWGRLEEIGQSEFGLAATHSSAPLNLLRLMPRLEFAAEILARASQALDAHTELAHLGYRADTGPVVVQLTGPEPFVIARGTGPGVGLSLKDDRTVSRRHCTIRHEGDRHVLRDENSTHGTLVNGVRLQQPRVLCDGDVLQIGNTLLAFFRPAALL